MSPTATQHKKKTPIVPPASLMRDPGHLCAFGFGSGLSPIMPGTMGSLIALPIVWLMLQTLDVYSYISVTIIAFAIGIWLCQRTADALGVHDHGGIVWDEILGMMIACFALPDSLWAWFWAFLLFRIFDMAKPPPIRQIDRQVSGGFGIMIDDVIAGIFALVLLQLGWQLFA